MPPQDLDRKLPAILSADVVGYSLLMRDNEEARKQAERLLELHPTFSIDEYAETIFRQDEAGLERHIANLRKAGLK
jgi:hypothetical protein